MASTRDFDLEKKRWRWTYHLFRGVVALCVLYVVGTQIIERAARSAGPAPAPSPIVEPPPRSPPVAEAPQPPATQLPATQPPATPPSAMQPPATQAPATQPPAPPPAVGPPPPAPPPPQVVEAPPRPIYRVPGQVINGRAGPGSGFAVVRRVTSDLVLVAIGDAQNDWLEVFVRGAADDRFWVYRPLVVRAETP